MKENITKSNENVEEVPLDLFDQVSLEDAEPVEVVDLSNKEESEPLTGIKISIPANAYNAILEKKNNSYESQ